MLDVIAEASENMQCKCRRAPKSLCLLSSNECCFLVFHQIFIFTPLSKINVSKHGCVSLKNFPLERASIFRLTRDDVDDGSSRCVR
jgi:hypothetical protein